MAANAHCPACGQEYDEPRGMCADCSTPLVAGPVPPEGPAADADPLLAPDHAPVLVTSPDPAELRVLSKILRGRDIPTRVDSLEAPGRPQVLRVSRDHVSEATRIIEEYRDAPEDAAGDVELRLAPVPRSGDGAVILTCSLIGAFLSKLTFIGEPMPRTPAEWLRRVGVLGLFAAAGGLVAAIHLRRPRALRTAALLLLAIVFVSLCVALLEM